MAAIGTANCVRYVSPAQYAAAQSLRASGRTFAIITYIVCVGAGLWAAVGSAVVVLGVTGAATRWPTHSWTVPAAAAVAIVAGALNVYIRRAAVRLDSVRPVNRETAGSLPDTEVLVRASGAPRGRMRGELLRANYSHVSSGRDLLRVPNSRVGFPDDTSQGLS